MSSEYTTYVRVSDADREDLLDLAKQAQAALASSAKAPPGNRDEIVRFEAICTAIEERALRAADPSAMARGEAPIEIDGLPILLPGSTSAAPQQVADWLDDGHVVAVLALPHAPGPTNRPGTVGTGPAPPAEAWQATTARRPHEAIVERFDDLLAKAVEGQQSGVTSGDTIRPSGVPNKVLTSVLRGYVQADGTGPLNVPVTYQDGSSGAEFPLRSLHLADSVNSEWRELRFAMMSIRHVEMDAEVTGAWFRNMLLSRNRPAGLTDQVAYEASGEQIARIADDEPSVIYFYQTGFQAAVVGFYRAVVEHLMSHPNPIAVVPMFYRGAKDFKPGKPWAI